MVPAPTFQSTSHKVTTSDIVHIQLTFWVNRTQRLRRAP